MTTEVKETKTEQPFSYDTMPYPHHAFGHISPEHLESIGTVFEISPAKASTARVLELGCGSGLNSVAFASRHPKAKVIGVDLSKVQIEHGKKYITALKLDNIELKAMSIMDIDKSFGEFDYIICHGVFSWVPAEVQKKILEVINAHLAPNGMSLVSYNALPGWNIAQTFRDMMQYHSDMFVSDQDKLLQAGAFVQFIDGALAESNTPYSKFLRQEAEIVASQAPSYIKHEYLDKGNSHFYFSDFANSAAQHGLAYLGDTSLSSMYLGNLPEKAFEKLKAVGNIVAVEQYMDFITNRRFRNTILCKANTKINRNVSPNIFEKLNITAQIIPATNIAKVNFEDDKESLSFTMDGSGTNFNTTSAILKATFYTFAEHRGKLLSINELSKEVASKLPKFKLEEITAAIKSQLVQILFKGLIEIRATAPASIDKISAKPATSKIARYEISAGEHNITNEYSNSIPVNLVQKLVIFYANGENTLAQIIDLVLSHVTKGELTLNTNDKPVSDKSEQHKIIEATVKNTLEVLKNNYYLVG